MPRPDKVEKVKEIRKYFDSVNAVIVTEYRGLNVKDMAELRKSLRENDVEYRVLKNTLVRIALRDTKSEPVLALVEGPIAVAFVRGDVSKAAQALISYSRAKPELKVKGGFIEGRLVEAPGIRTIATLPPREVLLARLVGTMNMPVSNLVGVLSGPSRSLVQVLNAIRDKKEEAA